ncbi:MAG: polyketide synthase and peptide synthetase, partial [Myxococcaceae bacterium]|nr:polyketide synthase and peptide synthetase [Myxococcaceae bacterium]
MTTHESLVDRLRRRGREAPSELLYTFLDDAGADADRLTCGDALADAESVAALLADAGLAPGDRALLVYAPSLDFVRAFLGCLLARVVPVPIAPPNPYNLAQDLPLLAAVARSARAQAFLTDATYAALPGYVAEHPEATLPDLPWLATTGLRREAAPARPSPAPDDVAFVQYTSGSTSAPRGVLITYGNLAHQLAVNARELDLGPEARMLMWVPHYHDFGLVSGILAALHGNGALWMMSPLAFAQRPHLWLEAASRVRATHTVSPNFGFDLAVRRSTPAQRAAWDLSALRVVMSAAEPVRPETVRAFLDAHAPCGLDPRAFCPAYGLAEHTVGVSVRGRASARLDRAALESDGRVEPARDGAPAVDLVGCGRPSDGVTVRIVDPDARVERGPGRVGEIWVSSPSRAAGYDGLPDETRETFAATLGDGPAEYLRTGDLGFVHEGELFVVGRIKDTIIVRGRNLHPQDLEDSVRSCHPLVRPGGVAAFALRGDAATGDGLAVLVELRDPAVDPAQYAEVVAAVRARVVRDHAQACQAVILGAPGAALKTSSGKLRRGACRAAFERGELASLHVDRPLEAVTLASVVEGMDDGLRAITRDLGRWFARASKARGGRTFHKRATTLAGYAEAAPDDALPAHPLFAPGARYPVLVRHANGVQDDDAAWDNRGATVRLLDPARGGDLAAPLLDLLLTTGRCFLAPTAQAFVRWMSGSPAQREAIARADSAVATAAWEMFRAPDSYTAVYYYSKTAALLVARDGSRRYARFRLRRPDLDADSGFVHGEALLPPDSIPRRDDDPRAPDFLHAELRERLARGGVDYVVEVQIRAVEASALDCTHPWPEAEHPWRVALRLHLDRALDDAAVEPLHFSSLHAPADLAPPAARSADEPASLETVRQVVYEVAACARRDQALPAPLAALMR